ncbi:MAG: putative phage integrase, partial [Massilia sp.]|nr:putative phage integrase [Massilia sp.]
MKKLTSKQVEALRATDQPIRVEVDMGLQLRVAINGIKTWVVRYRVDGERRDYRLPK